MRNNPIMINSSEIQTERSKIIEMLLAQWIKKKQGAIKASTPVEKVARPSKKKAERVFNTKKA